MWSVELLLAARDEMAALPSDMRASFERIVRLIEAHARALYEAIIGRRIVVLRVFVKKKQKTPRREIELALKRAKEMT